ncbi:hypothetical protein [Paracoccus onubensis]|uniref:Uncharacterized protein n=1 Tax=Paracoccus onubensis TaxID=1675788 RepID=A0A418SNF8_9RHOB|nr:hypothetical protein [Paracoccus onubensis]RJE82490.1 hypothetical protein D3P04_19130 [Paracoccus onubensis]
MKSIGLVIATLFFFGLSVLIVAWPDLKELRRGRNWDVAQSDQSEGELHGVRVFVDQTRAMILPAAPDRALIYLRLGLQGEPDQMRDWLSCDIGLTDDSGRKWLPLANAAGAQITGFLGDDPYEQSCNQSLSMPPEDGSPSFSGQPFLVPADVVGGLRLEISGLNTRPDALSLPLNPVMQLPPG